ncbi:MAG: type IV secretion protein IcmS [Gammaproteobacteria bacterium]|nr:type IV secretion protein IcmS [Gammaproteobacteria bacterium]
MNDLTEKLSAIAKELKVTFTLKDKRLTYEEVFSPTGMLPPIAKRADQLASLCLGYGLGVSFEDYDSGMAGSKAKFDETTPDIIRYFFILDVLNELIQTSSSRNSVALDELMYEL